VLADSFDNNFDGFSFVKSSSNVDESIMVKTSEKIKDYEKAKYERQLSLELEENYLKKEENLQMLDEKELQEIIMEEYF
jgi:hypothetical protein